MLRKEKGTRKKKKKKAQKKETDIIYDVCTSGQDFRGCRRTLYGFVAEERLSAESDNAPERQRSVFNGAGANNAALEKVRTVGEHPRGRN